MEQIRKLYSKNREVISYLFWGVCTTVVSWGSYSLFVKGLGCSVAVGNTLSWICAVVFAYVVNKLFVFQSHSWKGTVVIRELGLFLSARLVTGLIEIAAVPLLVQLGMDQQILGVDGALSKVVVSVVIVLLNYGFSKLVIFRGNPVN